MQPSTQQSKKKEKEFQLYTNNERYADHLQTCQFCMKMCRFACPVAEVTKSELLTPWGKVSAVGQHSDLESDWALTSFECNHCNLCTAHCKHENPVEALLVKQRSSIPPRFIPMNMNQARDRLKKHYAPIIRLPQPETKKGSILYWPAMGIEKIDRVNRGKTVDSFYNRFEPKIKAMIERVSGKEAIHTATVQDLGFELYSAGLEEEFLSHIDLIRQEIDRFELVIFESAADFYVLDSILNRYGHFQLGNFTHLYTWAYENVRHSLIEMQDDRPWILWTDGLYGREQHNYDRLAEIAGKLRRNKESWVVPEGRHRPAIFSEGFIPYYSEEKAEELAGPALDYLSDYRGTVIFTSYRDWEFIRTRVSNECIYLPEWLIKSMP